MDKRCFLDRSAVFWTGWTVPTRSTRSPDAVHDNLFMIRVLFMTVCSVQQDRRNACPIAPQFS
jgi:hypothetical protein